MSNTQMKIVIILFYMTISHVSSLFFSIPSLWHRPQKPNPGPPPKKDLMTDQERFDLSWHVIGTVHDFPLNQPKKIQLKGKMYTIWKTADKYVAHENECPHKGASMANGYIHENCITCPYHGYEYNDNGKLTFVPGVSPIHSIGLPQGIIPETVSKRPLFPDSEIHNLATYPIVKKGGWVWLNTIQHDNLYDNRIFLEPEADDHTMYPIFLEMEYRANSRVVTENSLDIMHIAFVHTFGNRQDPNPIVTKPPSIIGLFHVGSSYLYKSGEKSLVKRYFDIDDILIENQFVLSHTAIARIKFHNYTNTVVTYASPINATHTKLFVKVYRNFWQGYIGDYAFRSWMRTTMEEDKEIVEEIDPDFDGFNMRYDKLMNTYRTYYRKFYEWL